MPRMTFAIIDYKYLKNNLLHFEIFYLKMGALFFVHINFIENGFENN